MTLLIGGRSGGAQAALRKPRFVSPSTNGFQIQVYAHGGNTIIGQSNTDISSGSPACGGQTGTPRTCTVSVPAPVGNDDFVGTTYDAPPSGNSFAAAHMLGRGYFTSTIVAGTVNGFTLYLGGVVTSLGYLAPNVSFAPDGVSHTVGFVLNPSDYGNNPIVAGSNDPYANPISVVLNENLGSGHVQIVKNGTPTGGTSTTLNFSNDTVAVKYDGGGATGYYATATVSASNVTPETLTLSALFALSPSPYYAAKTLTFNAAGQSAQVNLTEGGAANTTTYTATPTAACAGVAAASAPSGTGTAASLTVTAGSTGGTCAIAFSDGTTTVTWTIVNSLTTGSVTVPSNAVGPITFASYSNGAVRGQNGWLSNSCSNNDYNANVVNTSSYPSAQWPGTPPTKALQMDNSVVQTCFSGLATPPGPQAAGYPNALADQSVSPPSICGSTCNPYFSMEFVVTSATGAFQPALELDLSPVWNNQGGRMTSLGLWHTQDAGSTDKLLVFLTDYNGVTGGPPPCFQCANARVWAIAYVDPTLSHKIGLSIDFVQPGNDAVKVFVDGTLAGVGNSPYRSWEDYYLYDTEADPGFAYPYSRAVNDVLFRAGNFDTCLNLADYKNGCVLRTSGPGHTTTANNGFLFTNVTTCAGTAASCASAIQTSSAHRAVRGERG